MRSLVDDGTYESIKNMLDRNFRFVRGLDEITIYFSGDKDLRMRQNDTEAFVILKEGKIHDDFRKEFEVKIGKEDFDSMAELFQSLGYEIEIEWHRHRLEYEKSDTKALLDDTAGYGKILELEKMVEEGGENKAYEEILNEMKHFGIDKSTSKEEFDEKFEYYKRNWKTLIK